MAGYDDTCYKGGSICTNGLGRDRFCNRPKTESILIDFLFLDLEPNRSTKEPNRTEPTLVRSVQFFGSFFIGLGRFGSSILYGSGWVDSPLLIYIA